MNDVFADLVNVHLDESHHQLRNFARRFTKEHITPFAEQWEEDNLFDRALYTKAADAGLLAPHFPETYGGGGGDVFHSMVCTEEMMRGGSTGTVIGLGSLNIAIPPLLSLGTSEQKETWLPSILNGQQSLRLALPSQVLEATSPASPQKPFVMARDTAYRVSKPLSPLAAELIC